MRPALLLVALLSLLLATAGAAAREPLPWKSGQRIVFLGDSITYAGGYVQYVDAFLSTRFPDRRYDLINLGLASETVSGLSEPDHPYPRPNVHTRLERVLSKTKPDWVVACYGMNDGIYYPFSEERFRKYREGIRRLVADCHAAGAKVMVMTPAAFDPFAARKIVKPLGQPKYSWVAPYEDYDTVLTRYAEWILTAHPGDGPSADPHSALVHHLAAMRRSEPTYIVAGDGVHPNAAGQWVIAGALLSALRVPVDADRADVDVAIGGVRHGKVTDLKTATGEIRFDWESRIPLPFDPEWDRRLPAVEDVADRFDRYTLRITGLPRERYQLWESDKRLGEVTREGLEVGIDLLRYPQLGANVRAGQLLTAIKSRERILSPAWLTYVGHNRPDTPVGLPLDEARRKAEPLTAEIEKLRAPYRMLIRLTPL